MSTMALSIGGETVTTKLAMRMEDSLQAFAVRAACFIGELDVPYSEEFDGHDFGATHIIAYVGDEPAGTLRVRWFQSFAMPERLAVIQRFRGHNIGQLLLERCPQAGREPGLQNALRPGPAGRRQVLGKAGLAPAGRRGCELGRQAHRGGRTRGRSQQAAARGRSAGIGRCCAAKRQLDASGLPLGTASN